MDKLYTAQEFTNILHLIATRYKTVYLPSGTLCDVTTKNITVLRKWCPGCWSSGKAMARIESVLDKGTHLGADCSNLIKAILWGWNPSKDAAIPWGRGVTPCSNGLPDLGTDDLFAQCTEKTSVMINIRCGEALWFSGHIGIYVGKINGQDYVVDSTPSLNGVKLNLMSRQGWKQHGKLPWIDYNASAYIYSSILKIRTPTYYGDDVFHIQCALRNRGYNIGSDGTDGYYGKETAKAVKQYQTDMHLTADGIVGKQTVTQLGLKWR